MLDEKQSFNMSVKLMLARVLGIAFSIIIPIYLGRKLSVETYGTYKQLMLIFWFSQVALNLGLDDSAYYFLRKDPKNLPLYSFNALIFNLLVTGLLWFILSHYSVEFSVLIGNKSLAQYLSLMGYLTLVTVSSMQVEGMLISGLNLFKERLMVEIATEFLKSLAIIGAFYFYNSLYAVLALISAIMTMRLLMVIYIIYTCKKKSNLKFIDAPKHFFKQVKFGLPLGVSRVLQNILNMENFFISSFFSLTQFTYYTVGCFENPLVNAARTSMFELANIEMVDAMKNEDRQKAIEVWRSMTRKLFLIIVPFVTYMIFFAKELITFIFSIKYLPSVPFFIVFNFYLFVGALNPEPIFKSTSNTMLAFKLKVSGLFIGLLLLVAGAYWGGAIYALVGKILGVLIMNIMGLVVGARLLQSKFVKLFQWRDLAGVIFVSVILSLFIRFIFINTSWEPFWILAFSFSLYVILHFLMSCFVNLIRPDEISYLRLTATRLSKPLFAIIKF